MRRPKCGSVLSRFGSEVWAYQLWVVKLRNELRRSAVKVHRVGGVFATASGGRFRVRFFE